MKYLPVLALFAVAALCHAVPFFDVAVQEWEAFKLEYGKKYSSEVEDKFRMKIFMENKYKIAKHNAAFEKGYYNFTLGLNKYADMLPREFVEIMNGFNRTKKNLRQSEIVGATFISPANVELPTEVDWRDKGAVTPVKDQGHCGSCWAFSATGSLEGQHFRSTGKLVSLSEQNLIDCSAKYYNYGCDGGDMDQAFLYIRDNGGIDTEKSYPYEAVLDDCIYSPETNGATDLGYVKLKSGSEQKLKEAVATIGPISVAIDAGLESFQLYKEGVYSDVDCGSTIYDLDHAVLVVGYGTEKKSGLDYWIVKNSWSETWGDDGYIKMSRNNDNNCGIATYASYPLV